MEIAAPSQCGPADFLVAEQGTRDRNEDGRCRQHQRAVGDAGARQAADEEELVEDVTDHAEGGQTNQSRKSERRGRAKNAGGSFDGGCSPHDSPARPWPRPSR